MNIKYIISYWEGIWILKSLCRIVGVRVIRKAAAATV